MRSSAYLLFIGIMSVLFACSGGQVETITKSDSTKTDSSEIGRDTVHGSKEITHPEIQTYLRNFIRDFESTKSSLPSFSYEETFEYDWFNYTYYIQNGELLYITIENGAEGGYAKNLLIKRENGGDIVLKTSTDGGGSFTCMYQGNRSCFQVTSASSNELLITGAIDPSEENYSDDMVQQLKIIQDNKEKFTLKDSVYEYYLERKMVDSDYGKVEISKVYTIDKELFALDLTKVTKSGLDPDLIKKIITKWTPLYTLHGGYERQVVCGHEPSLVVKEEEGKIKWQELGLQDAWEGVVTGIRKIDLTTYEVDLSSQGNNSKRVLKEEVGRRILFINERPYTDDPEIFPVAEFDEDCLGGN